LSETEEDELGGRPRSRRVQVAGALLILGMISACGSAGAGTATRPARATAVTHDALTSYGATTAAWNAHHPATASAYSNVTPQDGRVVEYTVSTGAVSVAAAIARAKRELPGDVRELWAQPRGDCYQVELTSSALGRALSGPEIGDSAGGILAVINTLLPNGTSTYRPTAVNQIMLSPGSYPEPADAPDC
jgi:hypothetical protein